MLNRLLRIACLITVNKYSRITFVCYEKFLSVATFLFVAIIASASLSPTGPDGGEYFITSGCVKCGTCVGACPVGAIYEMDNQYQIDWRLCVSCGACADECPVGAIWYGSATAPKE